MRKSNFKESFYKGSLRRTSFATLQIYSTNFSKRNPDDYSIQLVIGLIFS